MNTSAVGYFQLRLLVAPLCFRNAVFAALFPPFKFCVFMWKIFCADRTTERKKNPQTKNHSNKNTHKKRVAYFLLLPLDIIFI